MVLNTASNCGLGCIILLLFTSSWSKTIPNKNASSEERTLALETYKKLRKVEKTLLASLRESQTKLTELSQQIAQTRIDLSSGNRKVNELETERRELEAELQPLPDNVRRRLKARQLSLSRGEAFLRLLVQREGATSFLRSKGYLNEIAKLDLNLLAEYYKRRSALTKNLVRLKASHETLRITRVQLSDAGNEAR